MCPFASLRMHSGKTAELSYKCKPNETGRPKTLNPAGLTLNPAGLTLKSGRLALNQAGLTLKSGWINPKSGGINP